MANQLNPDHSISPGYEFFIEAADLFYFIGDSHSSWSIGKRLKQKTLCPGARVKFSCRNIVEKVLKAVNIKKIYIAIQRLLFYS